MAAGAQTVFLALITPGLVTWREKCRDDSDIGRRDG